MLTGRVVDELSGCGAAAREVRRGRRAECCRRCRGNLEGRRSTLVGVGVAHDHGCADRCGRRSCGTAHVERRRRGVRRDDEGRAGGRGYTGGRAFDVGDGHGRRGGERSTRVRVEHGDGVGAAVGPVRRVRLGRVRSDRECLAREPELDLRVRAGDRVRVHVARHLVGARVWTGVREGRRARGVGRAAERECRVDGLLATDGDRRHDIARPRDAGCCGSKRVKGLDREARVLADLTELEGWGKREASRRPAALDGRVLVVALGVDLLAGGAQHEITIEAIGPSCCAARRLDVVREGREGPWSDGGLCRRRVTDGRDPSGVPSCFAGILRVACRLVVEAGGEVDLRAGAARPGRRPCVHEDDLEALGLAWSDVDERRLRRVRRVVARYRCCRYGHGQHAQRERDCCDRGRDLSHTSFLFLLCRWNSRRLDQCWIAVIALRVRARALTLRSSPSGSRSP